MNIPRIMITAAGSGSGKTLLSCALMMLFSQEGKSVSAIKCGPDYIDPMFHRTVLGVPSRNLDTFFTGERLTKSLFARAAEGADLAVMEGVMGLYDAVSGTQREHLFPVGLVRTRQFPASAFRDDGSGARTFR